MRTHTHMHTYMYMYTLYMRTDAHTYTHADTHTHIYKHTHTHAYFVHAHTHTHTRTHTDTHTHTHTYTHTDTHTCTILGIHPQMRTLPNKLQNSIGISLFVITIRGRGLWEKSQVTRGHCTYTRLNLYRNVWEAEDNGRLFALYLGSHLN